MLDITVLHGARIVPGDAPDGWLIEYAPTLSGTNWFRYDGPVTNNSWFIPMESHAPPSGFYRLRMYTNE